MISNQLSAELLADYLLKTLSPDLNVRKPAEKFIESCESQPGYSQHLLQLIQRPDIDPTIKLCASCCFKNYVKKYWEHSDDPMLNKISEADREFGKNVIVDIMLNSEEKSQRQLSEAVSLIGKVDFPEKWPNLLNKMIDRLDESCQKYDFNVINGILQTLESLFRRYQYEWKSEKLWREIKFVLDTFAKTFTVLFTWLINLIQPHINNKQNIKIIFTSLEYCSKIFYSLNSQDLPEFFEDNLNVWMTHFIELLRVNVKLLETDTSEEVGIQETLKKQICENISMYAEKYSEEFESYIPGFISQIWTLLDSLDNKVKYDQLVSNAIHFLCTVANRGLHKSIFEKEEILQQLCSRVIIPNMEFRESDEEMFEDNCEEYIRCDVEGADVQTRRRSACDLVKALSRYFEKQMTEVFSKYIESMLQNYNQNPQQNWKSKSAAIYLVTSLVVKGGSVRLGTTSTSDLISISTFFNNIVRVDLERVQLEELPVLKADALKYVIVFRNQLSPNEILIPILPHIIRHLYSPNIVIHSYASICIEKILTLRDNNKVLLKPEIISEHALPLLEGLFAVLQLPGSGENEYAIKAILCVFNLFQERLLPYFNVLLPKLTDKISQVAKNPSKPNFNHYLFETLGLSIKIACTSDKNAVNPFQEVLFPIFQLILNQDVQEFMPYVFQILALLLEYTSGPVPESYMQLFPFLLTPLLWERQANFQPVTRLLQSYIKIGSKQIIELGKLMPLLGVFQKLIASKANDELGFKIINNLILYADSKDLFPSFKQIFILLFQRLTHSKTVKFVRSLLVFFSLFVYKYGTKVFYDMVESLQNKLFRMVVEKLYITDSQKMLDLKERKIVCIGLTKILTELNEFFTIDYLTELWPQLLQIIIAVIELPCDQSVPDEDFTEMIELVNDYQVTYSKLRFASTTELDIMAEYEPKLFLAQQLHQLSVRFPGKINLLSSTIEPKAQEYLRNYCLNANVTIS